MENSGVSKRRSICFFAPYGGRGNISGIQVRLRMLAPNLEALGYDVHVIGPYEEIHGATTHYFSLDVPLLLRPFRGLAASHIIRRLRPSVVILEGPAVVVGLRGTKVIQMIHDSKFVTEHRRRGGWLLWFFYFVMCRVYSCIMTVSEAEKTRIASSLRLARDRIVVSYNGIGDDWSKLPKNLNKDFDLIYVSNFAKHKGHIRFLQSIVGLGYRVALVGGDLGTLAQVRTFANEYKLDVQFFHNLSETDLIDVYDRSRVFVFPSELEGFGIPFLEARARALPVVASDLEVFHELATLLGATIVDFSDTSAVRKAIFRALEVGPQPIETDRFQWKNVAADLSKIIFSESNDMPAARTTR